MYSSISSNTLKRKKKNLHCSTSNRKSSQVTRPPSQTSAKAEKQKKKLPLTAYSAKERLEKVERTQWGMNSPSHNRCLWTQRTSAAQQCELCNNLKIFSLSLTLRATSLLLWAVVNSRLKWENSCKSKGSYRSWRRRVLHNTASVMP